MKLVGSHAAWNGLRESFGGGGDALGCLWLAISCIGDLVVYVIRVLFMYVEGDGCGFLSSEVGDSLSECVCNLHVV